MTLSVQTPRAIYAGSGTTGPFAVEDADGNAIYFTANAQILVSQFAASGTETEFVEGTDYTLTGGPDAGSVTLSTALATGETLVIWRSTTLSQETNFAVNDPYRSSVHGAALDRVVRMLQEINDRGLRSIRLPRTAAASAVSEIPVGSENGILGVGDDGSIVVLDPSEVDGLTGALGVRPITQGGTGATTAEEAIANLGIDDLLSSYSQGFGLNVGDVKLSLASSPDAGFVRLTDAVQNLLKADYPDLHAWVSAQSYPWGSASTTFGIPAAGGYFLRFGASGSSIDPSGPRTPGTAQAQAYLAHTHTGTTSTDPGHTHGPASGATNFQNDGPGNDFLAPSGGGQAMKKNPLTATGGSHSHTFTTASSGGAETRPINVTMYADMLANPALVAYGLVGAAGFAYKYTTGVSGDPGTGYFGLDNTTIASATTLRISKTASNGASLSDVLSALRIGTNLFITMAGATSRYIFATLTSTATDNSTYLSFTITGPKSGGTIANNDQFGVVPVTPGAGYNATSTTSLAIATGSKAFTIGDGYAYSAGVRAKAASAANTANYMAGVVASYTGGVLTITVDTVGGSGTKTDWNISIADSPAIYSNITFDFDGGTSVLTSGLKARVPVDFSGVITKATLVSDTTGSIVIDIWKDVFANYPPTVADTITASAKPTLSSASSYADSTLTGWTTTVTAGDVLLANIDSVSGITNAVITLKILRS